MVCAHLCVAVSVSLLRQSTAESLVLKNLQCSHLCLLFPCFSSPPLFSFSGHHSMNHAHCTRFKVATSELYTPRRAEAEECSLLPRQQHKEPVRTRQLAGSQLAESHQYWSKGLSNEHHSAPVVRGCEQKGWKGENIIEGER